MTPDEQSYVKIEQLIRKAKDLPAAQRRLDDKRHALARRVREVDRAIDRAVYRLYDLTEAEIRVVEGK